MERVFQATSALSDLCSDRRVCVVSSYRYALARPWPTFFMCPIELDPVQSVMAVYPVDDGRAAETRSRSGQMLPKPNIARIT